MVANGRPLKDVSSSASVVRKPERTLGSSRRDWRALEVTSWRRIMSESLQDVIGDELGVPERATGLTGRPGYSKM